MVPLPIPKIQKLNRFRPLYFGGALFSVYFIIFSKLFSNLACGVPAGPVVPLAGPWCLGLVPLLGGWCSWQACGGPDKYVVSLGSSMVPLLELWCPRPQGEGHDPCDPLGSAPGAEKVLAGLGMVSRTGQGRERQC